MATVNKDFEWCARTPNEKANARAMIKRGTAKIIHRNLETYIGKIKLVSYEAWCMQKIVK